MEQKFPFHQSNICQIGLENPLTPNDWEQQMLSILWKTAIVFRDKLYKGFRAEIDALLQGWSVMKSSSRQSDSECRFYKCILSDINIMLLSEASLFAMEVTEQNHAWEKME